MRPFRGLVWCCALAAFAATGQPARAAWNNVFQVCCNHCGQAAPAPTVAAYADPCPPPCPPPPCPQTTCTTRYVQRCYYQPVTTYRTSTYYEPVTTYRTSYYYEPVCSYRYSCYYDPCTCSYHQVAQPVTSYRLRSQCCPVTSYLQRTCCTPVTTYRQAFYYEPVTTCCTTTTGAPVAAPPPPNGSVPPGVTETREPAPGAAPSTPPPSAPPAPPPGAEERRDPGTPATERHKFGPSPGTPPGAMPRAADNSFRQPTLRPPVAPAPRTPTPPPTARLDRIASLPGHNLEGRVLGSDRRPRSGARILLVSAERRGQRRVVTADHNGQFRTNLSEGGWLVYTHDAAGRPVFARRVEVRPNRTQQMTLTGR